MRNVTTVPVGTLNALGTKPKKLTFPLPCSPTSTVLLPGAGVFASVFAVASVDAAWRRTVRWSWAAEGTLDPDETTRTIPVMPGWTSQK